MNKRAKRQMAFPFVLVKAGHLQHRDAGVRGPKHEDMALKTSSITIWTNNTRLSQNNSPTSFWKDVVVCVPIIACWEWRAGDLRGVWHHYWSRSPSIHQRETGLESHAGPKAHTYTRLVTDLSIYNPSSSGAAPVSRLRLLSLWAALCSALKAVYQPVGAADRCLPISIRYVSP